MEIFGSILIAVSLCADCFAVSLCSSVTIGDVNRRTVLRTALAFATIQSGLLLTGWFFGNLFVGMIERISHIIGFLLLFYVGGSMLVEGIRNKQEAKDLNGLKNLILGGVATSIDALAVGVAQSMSGQTWSGFAPLLISVFIVTAISVICGIRGGTALGSRFGRWAEIIGGLILIGIGISLLF